MPLLWTALTIDNLSPYPRNDSEVQIWKREMKTRTEAVIAWSSRSATWPLTLKFVADSVQPSRWTKKMPKEALRLVARLMDAVCGTSERWKEASIRLHHSKSNLPFHPILQLPSTAVPLLAKLALDVSFNVEPASVTLPDLLSSEIHLYGGQFLRSLSLPRYWENVFFAGITWSNMTEILIGGFHTEGDGKGRFLD